MVVSTSFSGSRLAAQWREAATPSRLSTERVATLDAMRGIAAVTVVLMHSRELLFIGTLPYLKAYPFDLSPTSWLVYATAPLMSGGMAVSLFFVLSGYLIHRSPAQALTSGTLYFDTATFLMHRFIRIYPVLLLALVTTFVCDTITRMVAPHHKLGDLGLGSLLVNVFSLQGLFAEPYGSNSPLWSLAIEMQFYLVYPLALMLRRKISAEAMLGVAAMVTLVGATLSALTVHKFAFPQYYLAWWVGAYMADREAEGLRLPHHWLLWSVLLLTFGCVSYQLQYCYLGRMAWAIGLAPIMMAVIQKNDPRLSQSSVLGWLGQFSYTLYAIHFPIIVLFSGVMFGGIKQPNILSSLLLTGLAISLCYPAYFIAERPTVQLLERWRTRRASDVFGLRKSPALAILVHQVEQPIQAAILRISETVVGLRQGKLARELSKAVARHPVFQPPHLDLAQPVTPNVVDANHGYFLSQRYDRVAHITFLLGKFGVDAQDRAEVDDWVTRYGSTLIPTWEHAHALRSQKPLWNGKYATLNVVHDLAVMIGERAIRSNMGWRWAQQADASGSGAVLTNGNETLDLVQMVAECCLDPHLRKSGLRTLRQRLHV